jgi:hypothetical protein
VERAMPTQPNTIPLIEAKERVAHALYGDDWIGELTQREKWLLKHYRQYLPQHLHHLPASLLPGGITYVGGGMGISTALTPSLREELARALDRQEWMIEQYEKVEQWFADRGFKSNEIDRNAFERAFAKSFPKGVVQGKPATKRTKPVTGQPESAAKSEKQHARKQRARAVLAIKALWPNKIPDTDTLPDPLFCIEVGKQLRADCVKSKTPFQDVSNKTIIRARRDLGQK